jgi:hypothetical protein
MHSMPTFQSYFYLPAACLFAIVAVGCGERDGQVPVVGMVTFQGQPVTSGEIVFTPAGEAAASIATKIEAGKYDIRVPEGRQQVRITAYREVPGKFDTSNPGEQTPMVEMYIPPKYNDKTTLEVTVDSAAKTHDFTLGG